MKDWMFYRLLSILVRRGIITQEEYDYITTE